MILTFFKRLVGDIIQNNAAENREPQLKAKEAEKPRCKKIRVKKENHNSDQKKPDNHVI